MTRLESQPDISKLIRKVETEQLQLKNSQRVGASSYAIHSQSTGFQIFNFTSTGSASVTATFTADHQDNAFCELGYETFINGTAESNRDKTAFFDVYKQVTTDPRQSSWKITIWNNFYSSPTTFYVRYSYLATDSGVLTVQ